jgi:serine/threonine protein kinase
MISCCNLHAPPGFEDVWLSLSQDFTLRPGECSVLRAIVIFCNPYVDEEIHFLSSLVQYIDRLGHDAPPMFWAPHIVNSSSVPPDEIDFSKRSIVRQLLELGLDGIVPDEPSGWRLVLAIRAKIQKSVSLSQTLNDMVNSRRSRLQYTEHLKDCIQCMLWDYLRIRLTPSIPAIDPNLPAGEPRYLANYNFGQLLGRGMFGSVYRLHHQEGTGTCNEVVKVVDKASVKDIQDLKCTKRMIDVMQLVSSDKWTHSNVIKLFETYHTPTHILFRMENGGPENLYRRLSHRQRAEKNRPLSFFKVKAIISQAVEALRHLHVGPHVCHRDIKPENFICDEPGVGETIILKIADFDLALVQEGSTACRSPCGTVPFAAPEVLLEREYDGFAADMWSLATVLLEVLCGVRIVENCLNLTAEVQGLSTGTAGTQGVNPDYFARRIHQSFSYTNFCSELLEANCRTELRAMLPSMTHILQGMLNVDRHMRWRITLAKDALVAASMYVASSEIFSQQLGVGPVLPQSDFQQGGAMHGDQTLVA